MLAGVIASRVLYRGENLLSFKLQAIGFIVFVFAILAPLVMFTPQLAKRSEKDWQTMACSPNDMLKTSNRNGWLHHPARNS